MGPHAVLSYAEMEEVADILFDWIQNHSDDAVVVSAYKKLQKAVEYESDHKLRQPHK